MKEDRAKLIEDGIRLTWESLESHLKYTHTESADGTKFHKDCVREYVQLLGILAKLY